MPRKTYPRPWCRLDREYLAQDTVRELGERFGPTGPLVFLAIVLEAGKAPSAGAVAMRFSALAQLAFTTPESACAVVSAAAEVGLIGELESDEERFSGRLRRWSTWEAKDPTSAQRVADHRARL